MRLAKSFWFALCGLGHCIKYERNFRIHITAAVTVIIFAVLYGLERFYVPWLALAITLVIGFEAFNTAIEQTIDLAEPDFHPLAKRAKDISAGAVMLAAVCAVVVAVCIFSDTVRLQGVLTRFFDLRWLSGGVLYVLLCVWFILKTPQKKPVSRTRK